MATSVAAARAQGTFARPGVVRQGRYLVGSARKQPAGRVREVEVGLRRLVVSRDLELMESVEWTGAYAASDAARESYAGFVERLPAW